MAGIKYNRNMFTVGMISQKLQGNTESDSYNNSLLDCKNFYVRQTGGVFKRPGTVFVDTIGGEYRMKLFPYNLPQEESVVVGITHGVIIVYGLDGEICRCEASVTIQIPAGSSGTSKEMVIALTDDVIQEDSFHVTQNGNLLYVFSSVGIFSIEYKLADDKPSVKFNLVNFTFSPVGKTNTNQNVTIDWDGDFLRLYGPYENHFHESDIGSMVLVFWPKEDEKNVFSRFAYFKIKSYTLQDTVLVELVDRPKGVTEEETKKPEPEKDPPPNSVINLKTSYFCLPAFGRDRGCPVAAGFAGGRLFLAGSDMMIYGSALTNNDYFDFSFGDMDSEGISYMLSNDCGEIKWIVGQDKLLVGTPTGIFISGGSSIYENERITPSTVTFQKFSGVPAGDTPPVSLGAVTAFCDALEKNVYEISVDEATSTYKTFDLSLLSNELLNSGVVAHAWSGYPVKTYWCVCRNGKLVSMTYEKANNVMAWSYHELGGSHSSVESIASIRVDGSDRVFLVVRRTVDDGIIRTVEYIDKLYEPLDNKEHEQHYVDSGKIQKYVYPITKIKSYDAPFLDTQHKALMPNETSGVKHPRLCLFDGRNVVFDVYVDKPRGEGVSLCGIKEVRQKESTEGIDRFAYKKVPLDSHVLDCLSGPINVGVEIANLVGSVIKISANDFALPFATNKVNIGDKICLRNTGLQDTSGKSLDLGNNNIILFEVVSFGERNYTGYVIVRSDKEINTKIKPLQGGCVYKVIEEELNDWERGTNTKVTQHLDLASAVALSSYDPEFSISTGDICYDIVDQKGTLYFAVGKNIIKHGVSEPILKASTDIRKIVTIDGENSSYFTATAYVTNGTLLSLNGGFKHFLYASSAGSVYFIAGGKLKQIQNNKRFRRCDADAGWATEGFYFGITRDGFYSFDWRPEGNTGEDEVTGTTLTVEEDGPNKKQINTDGRAITACTKAGELMYVAGECGLLFSFKIEEKTVSLSELREIDLGVACNWAGIVEWKNGVLCWSREGDLALYLPKTEKEAESVKHQHLELYCEIADVFSVNDELYISLSNGHILKSVSAAKYTLTFIDMTTICIDDVVGMEDINGKKFTVQHIDTGSLSSGEVAYELWDDDGPIDSSKFGVYVDNFVTNGNVYLYFNKVVGLDHLVGEEVSVCLDGNFLESTTVSDAGVVAFPSGVWGKEAHVGYKYNSVLDLMPLSGGNARGSSVGSVGSQKSVFARLYYSLGGKYGSESDNMFKVVYPTTNDFNKAKKLYTGLIELPMVNPSDVRERKFRFEHTEPVSFNVLSIAQDAEISDA